MNKLGRISIVFFGLYFLNYMPTVYASEHYSGRYVRWDGGWTHGWLNDWNAHWDRGKRVWGLGKGFNFDGYKRSCKWVPKTIYQGRIIKAHPVCWSWR